jgi:hypothetical protein
VRKRREGSGWTPRDGFRGYLLLYCGKRVFGLRTDVKTVGLLCGPPTMAQSAKRRKKLPSPLPTRPETESTCSTDGWTPDAGCLASAWAEAEADKGASSMGGSICSCWENTKLLQPFLDRDPDFSMPSCCSHSSSRPHAHCALRACTRLHSRHTRCTHWPVRFLGLIFPVGYLRHKYRHPVSCNAACSSHPIISSLLPRHRSLLQRICSASGASTGSPQRIPCVAAARALVTLVAGSLIKEDPLSLSIRALTASSILAAMTTLHRVELPSPLSIHGCCLQNFVFFFFGRGSRDITSSGNIRCGGPPQKCCASILQFGLRRHPTSQGASH